MNWKNILTRALWTFFEGFFSALIITGFTKTELQATFIGAIAGGLSAIKTLIVEILQKKKEEM